MIDKNKIFLRNPNSQDDIKQISKLIYSTDFKIYGAMFNDETTMCKILNETMKSQKCNLNFKNSIIANYENYIIGIVCFVEENYFDDMNEYKNNFEKLNLKIPQHFYGVYENYWSKLINENLNGICYISNIAVDEKFQKLGVASKLLNNLKNYTNKKVIALDVVKENTSAINAYIKNGFKIIEGKNEKAFRMIFEK